MTKTKKALKIEMDIPQGVEISIDGVTITVKGAKGEMKRSFNFPNVKPELKDKKVIITATRNTQREKKLMGTLESHIINMIKGSSKGHIYELKICSGHFPMKVEVKGTTLSIINFLGEKFPRTVKLKEGVSVKVEGDKITVESSNKELAGQTAADIEQLTRRPRFDPRIFQDGVYITNKDGKLIK